jgi:cell fate regulator YaaT (PSP1 superfamily)
MANVTGVCFHSQDKVYNFDSRGLKLGLGDVVIVETEMGIESGKVVSSEDISDENVRDKPLKPILRKATTTDLEKIETYKQKIKDAMAYCRSGIERFNLPMKLIDAHFAFDGSRLTYFFTADSRIDFRELVKDLTRHFQKSIRLQQIGSRDAAAKIGGCGVCGKKLCCSKFLKNFESITIDMARVQQIEHRGSERLSGCCGRLMCCLNYEADTYKNLLKNLPQLGQEVSTSLGKGTVVNRDILKQKVLVDFGKEERIEFDADEVKWKRLKAAQ